MASLSPDGDGIQLIDSSSGSGSLTVTCDNASTAAVDLGIVPSGQTTNTGTTSTVSPQVRTGADVNPQETQGIFTALLLLQNGIQQNNTQQMQRAMNMLDSATTQFNFAQAQLGAEEQGVQSLTQSLTTQNTNLTQTLSQNYDTNMASAISDLMEAQTAYQATLEMTAQLAKTTLLNYL